MAKVFIDEISRQSIEKPSPQSYDVSAPLSGLKYSFRSKSQLQPNLNTPGPGHYSQASLHYVPVRSFMKQERFQKVLSNSPDHYVS